MDNQPKTTKTAKDCESCNGCDRQSLPHDSGFCYMFKNKPEPRCYQHTNMGKVRPARKMTPAQAAIMIGVMFGWKP